MELTTEDRHRIEQATISYTGGYNQDRHDSYIGFVKGAEYATIYERRPTCQSCHKGKVNSQGECDFCGAHAVLVALMPKPDVEAEFKRLKSELLERDAIWLPAKDAEIEERDLKIKQLEAERTELIRKLESRIKAINDAVKILQEVEEETGAAALADEEDFLIELLNSLKK